LPLCGFALKQEEYFAALCFNGIFDSVRFNAPVFLLIISRGCLIIMPLSMEQEENESIEDFPSIHNSAVFLWKLFRQDNRIDEIKGTKKIKNKNFFWKEEENEECKSFGSYCMCDGSSEFCFG
jgi:hypothetical protein